MLGEAKFSAHELPDIVYSIPVPSIQRRSTAFSTASSVQRADSVTSGEEADSECIQVEFPRQKTSVRRKVSERKRSWSGQDSKASSTKSRASTRSNKSVDHRKIKKWQRPPEAKDLDNLPECWVEEVIKRHHFDSRVHRPPLGKVISTSSSESEEETLSVVEEGHKTTDSEEYDTDLETKLPPKSFSSLELSGCLRYRNACKRLRVAPCSIFLRQCREDHLCLKHYGLGPKETQALAAGFRDNSYLLSVDLSYNRMGTLGVLSIAQSLRDNQHIRQLDLSYCFLGKEITGAMAVFTIIKNSSNINHLSVSHNCFKDSSYKWFAQMLRLCRQLVSLNLSDNELGPVGIDDFADALEDNEILEELDMEWNPLTPFGSSTLLKAVAKNMNLRSVKMGNTGIDDSTCNAVLQVLRKNDFLQSLDIHRHRLSLKNQGAIAITREKTKSTIDVRF